MARPEKPIDALRVARVIGALGGTDEQLADALGISRRALAYRKGKDPELFHTLKEAKADADAGVERSLYQRAIGYTCDDRRVLQHKGVITVTSLKKHNPPDVTACIFWLKIRKPREWRDRPDRAELKVGQEQEIAGVPQDVVEALRRLAVESVACPEPSVRNGNGS